MRRKPPFCRRTVRAALPQQIHRQPDAHCFFDGWFATHCTVSPGQHLRACSEVAAGQLCEADLCNCLGGVQAADPAVAAQLAGMRCELDAEHNEPMAFTAARCHGWYVEHDAALDQSCNVCFRLFWLPPLPSPPPAKFRGRDGGIETARSLCTLKVGMRAVQHPHQAVVMLPDSML